MSNPEALKINRIIRAIENSDSEAAAFPNAAEFDSPTANPEHIRNILFSAWDDAMQQDHRGHVNTGDEPPELMDMTTECSNHLRDANVLHEHVHIMGATGSGTRRVIVHGADNFDNNEEFHFFFGHTGSGKSFCVNQIMQAAAHGRGFCLIDPHGTFFDLWMNNYSHRLPGSNIICLNPSNRDRAIPFNLFRRTEQADIPAQVDRRVSAIMHAWNVQDRAQIPTLTSVLRLIFAVLLEQNISWSQVQNFIDFRSGEIRDRFFENLRTPLVRSEWGKIRWLRSRKWHEEVLTSGSPLCRLVTSPLLHRFMGPQRSIDLGTIMDEGRILLVNLAPSDELSQENARILGTLLVNEFAECAHRRRKRGTNREVTPYYLCVDEARKFLSRDSVTLLKEARKFGLFPIFAHQHFDQPADHSQTTLERPLGITRGDAELTKSPWTVWLGECVTPQHDPIYYAGDRHIVTVAPTRSGKVTNLLVPTLLTYQGSCLVVDPKGQLAAITQAQRRRLGQRVIVLNPFGVLREELGESAKFNPLERLTPESESFSIDCDRMAEALIDDEQSCDSYWADSARLLLSATIRHLAANTPKSQITLAAVHKLICGMPYGFMDSIGSNGCQDVLRHHLAQFTKGRDSREVASIISMAQTEMGFLNNQSIADTLSSSDFKFDDLTQKPTTVYLILPPQYAETARKWARIVVTMALHSLSGIPPEQQQVPVLAILDEVEEMGGLSALNQIVGKSARSGLRLWLVSQELARLRGRYGVEWETLLHNVGVQFFGPYDQTTVKYISNLRGTARSSIDVHVTASRSEQIRAGDTWNNTSQWSHHCQDGSAPNGEQFIIVMDGLDEPICGVNPPYEDIEELRGLYSSDPYQKTGGQPII
jgi:type IV secretion system protein VirD4